jgi:hypothetical protein
VVERGTGEQQHQRAAVDAAADDVPGVAMQGGHDHQHRQTHHTQQRAQPVRCRIDRFFLEHCSSQLRKKYKIKRNNYKARKQHLVYGAR